MSTPSLLALLGGRGALEPEALAALDASPTLPLAVACSGGPDSVAAALLLRELFPTRPLTLLHFNHRLRGRASDSDAAFVQKLAHELHANFRLGSWSTPDRRNETAARDARLAFLHQWEHPLIVFGHHADDAAETFLLRLARGATLEGLCAPHAVNVVRGHTHLRPLLLLRKFQILAALKSARLRFRTDRTNAGLDYLRNRLRNKLLPLWQRLETRDVIAGLLASQHHLRALRGNIGTWEHGNIGASNPGKPTPAPIPFPSQTPGKPLPSATIQPRPFSIFDSRFSSPVCLLPSTTLFLPSGFSLSAELVPAPSLETLRAQTDPLRRVWISATASPLFVRAWTPGERYTPLNAPGSRKIKELLNENCGAFPPELRAAWPVVCDASGTPLWLPGCRIADPAAVAQSSTDSPPTVPCAIELNFSPPGLSVSGKEAPHPNDLQKSV